MSDHPQFIDPLIPSFWLYDGDAFEWAVVGTTIAVDDCVASNIVEVKTDLVTFLGAVVSIIVNLEGEEMRVDIAQKEFAKKPIKEKDTIQLYLPPDAFHVYSEIFT